MAEMPSGKRIFGLHDNHEKRTILCGRPGRLKTAQEKARALKTYINTYIYMPHAFSLVLCCIRITHVGILETLATTVPRCRYNLTGAFIYG